REVGELLASVAGAPAAPELAVAVQERTGGNPLYVTEIARSLARAGSLQLTAPGEVPETIRIAIGRRLHELSPACRELLALAALFGREFRTDTLGRATTLGAARVLELLDEAAAARIVGLVAEDTDRWRFAHALFG